MPGCTAVSLLLHLQWRLLELVVEELPRVPDAVIDAVVDVLEDEDYLVDLNRDAGRIDAQPSRGKTGRRVHLTIRVEEKKGRVQVDAQTRSQMDGDMKSRQLDEAPVLEFFHELDLRMQGIRD